MANQQMAFAAVMTIATRERPDLFSIKDGDFYFTDWRMTAWLVLAIADEMHVLEENIDLENNIRRMRSAELEDAA